MTIELLRSSVVSEWLDYNGHMNVVYYHMNFDRAMVEFLNKVGLGEDFLANSNGSMFALEERLTYMRELKRGDQFRVTLQLLDLDDKRAHCFLRMFNVDENYIASTCEHVSTFVDMNSRRSAAFPQQIQCSMEEVFESHRDLPYPDELANKIGIRR